MKQHYLVCLSIVVISFFASAHAKEVDVSILQNSTYHEDEIVDVRNGESWVAIVESNGKYTAKQVTVSVKTVRDAIVDPENGPFTGKEVTSEPTAIFLIKGIPLKSGASVKSYLIDTSPIADGRSVEIQGGLSTVKLLGKNGIHLKGDGYETNDAYQLIGKIDNEEFTFVAPTILDDNFPHLIWAGDLNNDDQPDLLIDTSNHYNLSIPTLFLSNVSKNKITYNKVVERRSVGC